MNFDDFIPFLEKLTNGRCRDVYYCPHEVRLSGGLHAIQNDCDFNEFLEDMNGKKRLDVYVDHHHEPLFDWIQEEEADLEDEELVSIDDVDSILEDGLKVEHNDDFVEEDHNAIRLIYPRHDHTQEWNQMKPQLVQECKKLALSEVDGSLKEYYAKLWDYAAEIRRANPGSHVEVFLEPQPDNTVLFDRFYVSFKGVVDGWLDGCRKVIRVDGFFLKGVCRGELLSTVGRDANNNIYPLAWVVVNVENKRTWKWFLDNLMEDIGGWNGHGITILSDGHKAYEYLIDRDPRRKPLITMLEDIRCWAMQRLWMKKLNGLSWDLDICLSIRREIEYLKELQRFWVPYVSGYKEFEVFSGNKRTSYYFSSIKEEVIWQPCVKRKRDQAEREISGYTRYTVSRACIPLRCTICHQTGHNKATCPSKPTPAPSTTGPSHSTPDSSTAGPSHVRKDPVKKGLIKRSPMKKVPLNDAGSVFTNELGHTRNFFPGLSLVLEVQILEGSSQSQRTSLSTLWLLEPVEILEPLDIFFLLLRIPHFYVFEFEGDSS
ncbi:unnamed protein product [Lactuca saligna]|uniref:MULE transposase domain-containing protein n=1 Tax=Lactuca saligna TaxID=75948 RepID=A0AA35Y6M9_LACSI|nr:unnamed protein product [Lactuca saligna]